MTDKDAVLLFKCLADKSRLQIIKSLAQEDMYVERLAKRLDVTPPTISFHLKKLLEIGAVTSYKNQYYTMYSLCKEKFAVSIIDLIQEAGESEDEQNLRDLEYKNKVIESFIEYGKLKSIPTQRKKRRFILEVIAEKFEKGRKYSEREVNIIIADFHDDFCTLRREMICEKLLEREKNIYWKAD